MRKKSGIYVIKHPSSPDHSLFPRDEEREREREREKTEIGGNYIVRLSYQRLEEKTWRETERWLLHCKKIISTMRENLER